MNKVVYELKNIASVKNGSTPSTKVSSFYDGNIIWITPNDLSCQRQRYIYKGERSITKEGYDSCSTTLVPKGSILLSSRAPIGLLAIAGIELCTNQGFKNIVPNKNLIDNQFLFYYLKLKVERLKKLGSGTTFMELSKSSVENFKLEIPVSLQIQKSIAKVLSDLDTKIELNNQINQELEAMANSLYEYWFVQFDFPNEHGKPYKSSGGKMVYSQELKREIPEGWEVKKLSEWIKKYKNGDWGKETAEGNYDLKVSCVRGADINGLNGTGELNAPTRYILKSNDYKTLLNHDLIIEISGGSPTQSTGRLAFITEETLMRFSNPLICSNFCKALTLKNEKYLYSFVYLWNRLYDNGVLYGWEGKTSGIKNLLFESFVTHQKEVFPKSDIVEKFYEFAKTIHAKKQTNLLENQKLEELRDWLLPMLMNGQVTVSEAEEKLNVAAEPRSKYNKN